MCSVLPLPNKSLPRTQGTVSPGCLTTPQTQHGKNEPVIFLPTKFFLKKYTFLPIFVDQCLFLLPYLISNQSGVHFKTTFTFLSFIFPVATALFQVSRISLLDYCNFCSSSCLRSLPFLIHPSQFSWSDFSELQTRSHIFPP